LPLGAIAQNLATTLLRAPKQALIIGNSSYKRAPLLNPGNDAKGMAEALKATGFDVALGMDLGQAAMSELIQSYVERLAKTKAIGLFYFAGHGTQLAWRNYIVPLDADIANVEAIKERCIDINTLIAGIRKAGNPMNVIILDACRDSPFGSQVQLDQKGLSQLDAPPGTFLAYATSPGNTAIDGEGANGLYTEHLLREIKVPEAKIEDVFKRVRLSVRRGSKGLQIPWESTSLEEDFWFVPPKALKKLAEAEIEREFQVELGLWEKIKTATQPDPLEDYLRRYPGGHFSELAQLRLDQVLARQGEKKIQVISPAENPYSKGTAVANTNRKVGDSYTYRELDLYTKIVNRTYTRTIAEITDTEVIYKGGGSTDLLGNSLRTSFGAPMLGMQIWGVDYAVGKRWTSRHKTLSRGGVPVQVELEVRVVAREKITVPAGTFNAFVVEANGYAIGSGVNTRSENKRWIAPDQVRSELAFELFERSREGRVVASERRELVSFRQS
ncbi:MAG: caspase family protein, partial [Burkholderiales bacterium]